MNEPDSIPQPDRDRSLIAARNDPTGRLCPSGPDGEIDEWSIYDESLRRLVKWTEDTGCFFEDLQPLKEVVESLGFRLLPERFSVGYAESLAFVRDDVAVFDLRPANVVRTPDGVVAIIDAIPTRMDAVGQKILSIANG